MSPQRPSPPQIIGNLPASEIARRVKAELRDRMRRIRKAIGPEGRAERSAKIAEHVVALPQWKDARTVSLFVPMRTEVDVTLLRDAARRDGKLVAAPRMTEVEQPDGPPRLKLVLHLWEDEVEPVESGRMVREPPANAPLAAPEAIDLVIVPALALDGQGGRIGYGAGLYDGLLPTLTRAFRVGIAFDFQLVAELPMAEHDQRVHHVVTDAQSFPIVGGG